MRAIVDHERRSLLQAIVATIAALPVDPAALMRVAHESHAAAQLAGTGELAVLSAADAADIEAVAAQIIPTDDTPGAREAGVVYFIDRALATFLSQLARDYRAQLVEFQTALRERQSGVTSFASLISTEQVEYLRTVDHTAFFDTTRLLTLLGMFSMPAHGGNRGGVGWSLIGFEDRHFFQPPFGYYDRGYEGFVIDPAEKR